MKEIIGPIVLGLFIYMVLGFLGYCMMEDEDSSVSQVPMSTYMMFWPLLFVVNGYRGLMNFLKGEQS